MEPNSYMLFEVAVVYAWWDSPPIFNSEIVKVCNFFIISTLPLCMVEAYFSLCANWPDYPCSPWLCCPNWVVIVCVHTNFQWKSLLFVIANGSWKFSLVSGWIHNDIKSVDPSKQNLFRSLLILWVTPEWIMYLLSSLLIVHPQGVSSSDFTNGGGGCGGGSSTTSSSIHTGFKIPVRNKHFPSYCLERFQGIAWEVKWCWRR